MTQAQFQAIYNHLTDVKKELRIMSTTELEKQNLEAHVDLCAERYKGLHDRLSAIETTLTHINEDMKTGQKSHSKTRFPQHISLLVFMNL